MGGIVAVAGGLGAVGGRMLDLGDHPPQVILLLAGAAAVRIGDIDPKTVIVILSDRIFLAVAGLLNDLRPVAPVIGAQYKRNAGDGIFPRVPAQIGRVVPEKGAGLRIGSPKGVEMGFADAVARRATALFRAGRLHGLNGATQTIEIAPCVLINPVVLQGRGADETGRHHIVVKVVGLTTVRVLHPRQAAVGIVAKIGAPAVLILTPDELAEARVPVLGDGVPQGIDDARRVGAGAAVIDIGDRGRVAGRGLGVPLGREVAVLS